MSANVESMFYVRETPWHGLGVRVEDALTSDEAIIKAGLNWTVKPEPLYLQGSKVAVPNVIANVRDSNKEVLGVVTGKYKLVQNIEAFAFTDALLGEGVKYETAGSLGRGEKVWLLARMPDSQIVGDKFENYLVFTNSHDGKGSIRVAATSTRVVCQNTLNLALSSAKRAWSTKHMGVMEAKLAEAKHTLALAMEYQAAFAEEADKLAEKKMKDIQFEAFVDTLLPLSADDSDRKIKNITDMRDELKYRYMAAPDLSNIRGTKWGVLQAVADFATHKAPKRATATYKENLFDESILGNKIIDRAYDLLSA